MKKIIPCLVGGIVLGAGGMLGVTQIPSVQSSLFKDTNSSYENTSLEAENSDLKLNNSILQEDVDRLNSELADCNILLKEKDETIATQVTRIDELTAEKNQLELINDKLQNVDIPSLTNEKIALEEENADLKAELDTYKELVGSDIFYVELINSLQQELDSTSTALTTATAELEQLRVDKTSLETRVQELETELARVQEELEGYKSLGNIDKLNISSYNGTWYLNGTFEKYYTIQDGVVTLNANEDSGIVQCLYNQMYLFMNTNGSLAVNLSDDGNSFETADGEVFKKFYTNTTETIVSNLSSIAGTYSSSNVQLILNNDNTLNYDDGDGLLYGSYVCSSVKRNIGGNISIMNYITANIVNGDEHIEKHFEYTSDSLEIYDVDDDMYLEKVKSSSNYILSTSGFEIPTDNYIKVTVQAKDYIEMVSGSSVKLNLCIEQSQVSYSVCYVNGVSVASVRYVSGIYHSGITSVTYSVEKSCYIKYFDFYLTNINSSYYRYLKDFISITSDNVETLIDIIDVEVVNTTYIPQFVKNYINSTNKSYDYMYCSSVNDYINGTYTNDDLSINLTDGVSTITYTGEDEITASNVEISATTDGYDIYHDVVITYTRLEMVNEVEAEVVHTITLKFKNDSLTSSLLDDELLEL